MLQQTNIHTMNIAFIRLTLTLRANKEFIRGRKHHTFAFFSQIFFIQPLVRFVFGKIFAKDIANRSRLQQLP